MSVLTNVLPSQPRIRRKPAPSLELDARYPKPDPDDPFAPLSVLRSRTASTLGSMVAPPLTFRGTSTSHLPTLSYTGGRYPPDIYQAYFNSPPGSAKATNFEQLVDRSKWLSAASPVDPPDSFLHSSPQRRRSQSAVSRKDVRVTSSPPRTSPYGHSSLQSYVLVGARSSTPALTPTFTTEPLSMSPEPRVLHGSESTRVLASRHPRPAASGIMSVPSSQVHLPSSSEDGLTSPRKGGKLARFLPKKAASRLSGGPKSTDNLPLSMHDSSVVPFPQRSGGRPSRGKQMPEQNTFHARRKSSALFPAAVAANLHMMDVSNPVNATSGSLIYEPLTDADLGYISDSSIVPSRSHTSPLPPIGPPCAPKLVHARSQTMDGHLYRVPRHAENGNETVQPRPSTPAPPYSVFDEHAMPTAKQLMDASSCFVIAENGIRVPFCDLIKDKKTIVIFIRHFWCPMCQDYMFSVTTAVDPKLLQRADVNLVVIGNGSFNMIKSYRQIFRTPFAVYTDPSMRLHSALGMIRLRKMRPKSQIKRGGYIRHGNVSGLAMVVANAVRVGMPIWEKGGDPAQLGGEFVFGPGLTVSFAHRMPNAGCHAPVQRVLAAAGVGIGCEAPLSTPGPVARTTSLGQDEEQWMEERRMSLARIRERKIARRTGVTFPTCPEVASAEGRSPSSTGHSSIPSPLPDSDKDKGEKSGSATVRTEVTENRSQDSHDAILGTSVEETDTETVSVGSQTLTESDSGSEHTRTEEVEPHQLRDKAALLDLEDLDTAPGVTVSP